MNTSDKNLKLKKINNESDEEDVGVGVDQSQDFIGDTDRSQSQQLDTSFGTGMTALSLQTNLPILKLNVPLQLTHSDIFEVFSDVSLKEKFQVIEMEQTIATAVNKEPFSLKQLFMKCFPF